MRTMFDAVCPRCGALSSATGVSAETADEILRWHTCADGTVVHCAEPTTRVVLGPGERLSDEERRDERL